MKTNTNTSNSAGNGDAEPPPFIKIGFNNSYGEQNCFLNVSLQALMALTCARNSMQYMAVHGIEKVKNPIA